MWPQNLLLVTFIIWPNEGSGNHIFNKGYCPEGCQVDLNTPNKKGSYYVRNNRSGDAQIEMEISNSMMNFNIKITDNELSDTCHKLEFKDVTLHSEGNSNSEGESIWLLDVGNFTKSFQFINNSKDVYFNITKLKGVTLTRDVSGDYNCNAAFIYDTQPQAYSNGLNFISTITCLLVVLFGLTTFYILYLLWTTKEMIKKYLEYKSTINKSQETLDKHEVIYKPSDALLDYPPTVRGRTKSMSSTHQCPPRSNHPTRYSIAVPPPIMNPPQPRSTSEYEDEDGYEDLEVMRQTSLKGVQKSPNTDEEHEYDYIPLINTTVLPKASIGIESIIDNLSHVSDNSIYSMIDKNENLSKQTVYKDIKDKTPDLTRARRESELHFDNVSHVSNNSVYSKLEDQTQHNEYKSHLNNGTTSTDNNVTAPSYREVESEDDYEDLDLIRQTNMKVNLPDTDTENEYDDIPLNSPTAENPVYSIIDKKGNMIKPTEKKEDIKNKTPDLTQVRRESESQFDNVSNHSIHSTLKDQDIQTQHNEEASHLNNDTTNTENNETRPSDKGVESEDEYEDLDLIRQTNMKANPPDTVAENEYDDLPVNAADQSQACKESEISPSNSSRTSDNLIYPTLEDNNIQPQQNKDASHLNDASNRNVTTPREKGEESEDKLNSSTHENNKPKNRVSNASFTESEIAVYV